MNKKDIIALLDQKHKELLHWIEDNGEKYWNYGPEGKWTTGQHVIHLVQSLQPTNSVLAIPKVALKLKFGKANRPARSYDQVKERYLEKLAKNRAVVSPFSEKMPDTPVSGKAEWIEKLKKEKDKTIKLIDKKWSEKDLDTCLIPHPLMGRMVVREFLLWTAYHTHHHLNLIKKSVQNIN